MPWKRLEDILVRRVEDILKTSWRPFCKASWKRLEDVLKTYGQDEYIRLEDVFWSRKSKANIFVLIKTSWRRLEEVLWRWRRKTSLRRLQDVFIKANVCRVITAKFQIYSKVRVGNSNNKTNLVKYLYQRNIAKRFSLLSKHLILQILTVQQTK